MNASAYGTSLRDPGDLKCVGEQVEKLALGDPALAGDVICFTPRAGIARRQDGGVGDDPGVYRAERIVSLADDHHPAPAKFPDQPRRGRAITLAEKPARPDHRQRKPGVGHFPERCARNRPCCACNSPGPRRSVPKEPISSIGGLTVGGMAIRAGGADMDEAIDTLARAGLGEDPSGIDAPGLKLAPPAPITDLGRAMKHARDTRPRPPVHAAGSVKSPRTISTPSASRKSVRLPGRTRARTRSPWAIRRSAR